jgi:hypothetical protein
VLGYDVDRYWPKPSKLVINAKEAAHASGRCSGCTSQEASLLPVVRELARRGWVNKLPRPPRRARKLGGRPFDKATLYYSGTDHLNTSCYYWLAA